jgi:phosphate-selective porin
MVAKIEGFFSDFHEAFTQLHLGQLLASFKRTSRDRRDGGIDPNTDYILRSIISDWPRVDEDLALDIATGGTLVGHT